MPLDAFVDEAVELLEQNPEAKVILVEPVKPLRFAVRKSSQDQILGMHSGH